jgi:hypothetical protein
MQAALLFWKNLSAELEKMGFIKNPYDSCAANKMINGEQCTVLWHVDDLNLSHKTHKCWKWFFPNWTISLGKRPHYPIVGPPGERYTHEY